MPSPHTRRRGRRSLHDDTRGAAYVEFLIAFLPVFITFLALWQLGLLCVAKLAVQHAAVCAARAGAVAIAEPQDAMHSLSDGPRGIAQDAAAMAASPLINGGLISQMWVQFPDGAGGSSEKTSYTPSESGRPPMVRVRVTAEFICTVVPVGVFVCGLAKPESNIAGVGGGGATRALISAEASYPYQGARYTYKPRGS